MWQCLARFAVGWQQYSMWDAQLHPWFRRGMPPELDLDVYNEHYLRLSRETGDAAAAIRAVIREAVGQPPPPKSAPTPEVQHQPLEDMHKWTLQEFRV